MLKFPTAAGDNEGSHPAKDNLVLSPINYISACKPANLDDKYYPMDSVPRGYCVIINNKTFVSMGSRKGSDMDASKLKELFSSYLGFHTQCFNNCPSNRICELMMELQRIDHSQLSCLVIIILSHGENGNIYGTDDVAIPVEELTDYFSGDNCPSLIGKPKVFILQACRGTKFDNGVRPLSIEADGDDPEEPIDEDETDGGLDAATFPKDADFVLAYSTTPGYVSFRNQSYGTYFIKALTDVMCEQAHKEDFLSMLTEVNRKLAKEFESRKGKKKQMPAPVTTLCYKLLFPPINQE